MNTNQSEQSIVDAFNTEEELTLYNEIERQEMAMLISNNEKALLQKKLRESKVDVEEMLKTMDPMDAVAHLISTGQCIYQEDVSCKISDIRTRLDNMEEHMIKLNTLIKNIDNKLTNGILSNMGLLIVKFTALDEILPKLITQNQNSQSFVNKIIPQTPKSTNQTFTLDNQTDVGDNDDCDTSIASIVTETKPVSTVKSVIKNKVKQTTTKISVSEKQKEKMFKESMQPMVNKMSEALAFIYKKTVKKVPLETLKLFDAQQQSELNDQIKMFKENIQLKGKLSAASLQKIVALSQQPQYPLIKKLLDDNDVKMDLSMVIAEEQ